MTETPCYGKWGLFDSTHPDEHKQAKRLCMSCPVIAACSDHLDEVLAGLIGRGDTIEGTWAGRGFRINERVTSPETRAAEEAAYSNRDATVAHKEYLRGLRSEWINAGERVFQRRAKRDRRARADGAA